jgi:hypothetical protein
MNKVSNTKAVTKSLLLTIAATLLLYIPITPYETLTSEWQYLTKLSIPTLKIVPLLLAMLFLTTLTISPQIIFLRKQWKLPKPTIKSKTSGVLFYTLALLLLTIIIAFGGIIHSILKTNSSTEAINFYILELKYFYLFMFSLNLFITCLHCNLKPNWQSTPLRGSDGA